MIQILFTATFVRQYRKLAPGLRAEVDAKIELFRRNPRDPTLRFHKLKGKLQGYSSFSVDYVHRILVEEDAKGVFALLAAGNHSIYQ